MAWIESHQELRDHPKTKRLARTLGIGVPQAVGHLHMLWWWAMDYAPDGDLGDYDAADIADACGWDGDPDELLSALVECGPGGSAGFMERASGRLLIHDYDDYGNQHKERQRNADRKRRSREKNAQRRDIPPTSQDGHGTVTRQRQNVTGDRTDRTDKTDLKPSSPSAPLSAAADASVDDSTVSQSSMNDVKAVHAHYCETWRDVFPRGPRLTRDRVAKIRTRLKTYGVAELCRAIDAMHGSAWHRGDNPGAKPYGTLDFVIRSDRDVDRWLQDAEARPRASPPHGVSDWSNVPASGEDMDFGAVMGGTSGG